MSVPLSVENCYPFFSAFPLPLLPLDALPRDALPTRFRQRCGDCSGELVLPRRGVLAKVFYRIPVVLWPLFFPLFVAPLLLCVLDPISSCGVDFVDLYILMTAEGWRFGWEIFGRRWMVGIDEVGDSTQGSGVPAWGAERVLLQPAADDVGSEHASGSWVPSLLRGHGSRRAIGRCCEQD